MSQTKEEIVERVIEDLLELVDVKPTKERIQGVKGYLQMLKMAAAVEGMFK